MKELQNNKVVLGLSGGVDSTTAATIIIAILSSSVIVAAVNWFKDREKDGAQAESLSVDSLKEALVAVRSELREVRQDLALAREELEQLRKINSKLIRQLSQYGNSSDTI